MKGALDVSEPRTWWLDAVDQLAATPLVVLDRQQPLTTRKRPLVNDVASEPNRVDTILV